LNPLLNRDRRPSDQLRTNRFKELYIRA